MGFQQGLSGLNVSAKALDAIGNNIANSSTVGFKTSQVQFADVYAASLGGGGAGQIGIGASAPSIAQLFTQGNITTTNNPLDMAINGGGFYRLSDGGTPVYSRNGQFSLDKDGYMVNSGGLRVTGYGADATGAIVPGDFVDLRLSTTNIEPSATTASNVLVNLDSRSVAPSSMTNGTLTGSAAPSLLPGPGLTVTAANNTLNLVVDGVTASPVVDVPIATYATVGALATAMETAINSNPALAAANALVDVTVNTSGALVIASRSTGKLGSQGAGSSVSQLGGDGVTSLLGAPVSANGVDNFSSTNTLSYTGSTAQTVYDTLGNPHNLTMYFAKTSNVNTWQLYTALDGTFTGVTATSLPTSGNLTGTAFVPNATADLGGTVPITIDGVTQNVFINNAVAAGAASTGTLQGSAAVDLTYVNANAPLSLSVTVDGVTHPVTLPAGPYADENAVAIALESAIEGAGAFNANVVTIAPPGAGGSLLITSNLSGASSGISITATTAADATALVGATPTLVPGTGYDLTELAAELQNGIDAVFLPAGSIVVSTSGGGLVVTSSTSGGSSSVTIGTSTPTTLAVNLFGTPTATPGLAPTTTVTPSATVLSFDTTGALATAMPLSLTFDPATGATNPLQFSLDFTGSSQYGINFGVNQLLQDGYTSGRLTGLSVSPDGTVQGRYSNGKTRNQGQVVLVNFNNANGLTSLGNNVWAETAESGQPIPGTPGQGSLGLIQSAAVEESNTDLTAELVNMITQQRVYQANAQTIKTQDQVLQTLVNLR